jgi:hypothetical protein
MKISKILATLAVATAGTLIATARPAFAQVSTAAPINLKVKTQKPPKQVWLRGEVIHADAQSMMVRDPANPLMIHTFTYSPKVRGQMEKIIETGGYQYGDKVKVRCVDGQTVVLALKGKPSKPI